MTTMLAVPLVMVGAQTQRYATLEVPDEVIHLDHIKVCIELDGTGVVQVADLVIANRCGQLSRDNRKMIEVVVVTLPYAVTDGREKHIFTDKIGWQIVSGNQLGISL